MILRAALAAFLCVVAIGCNSDDGATSSDVTSVSVAVTETGTVPRAESSTTPAPPPTDVVDVESVPSGPDVEGVTTDPETGDGGDVGELVDARIAVPSGDIELGETDAFVVTANGSLFWHPGLLSGEPQEAIPIAIVDEGNQIGRVAGVVDGSVIFGSCCSPAAGEVAAATGSPGPSTRLTEGAAPTLSPDGAPLASVSDTGPVPRLLMRQNGRFRGDIGRHVRVPIEMVLGDVEPERDPRAEGRRRLELEAARLDDVHRVRRRRLDLRTERHPDVPADEHGLPRGREHAGDDRRRGRLALRAGDRDHAPLQPSRGEFEFPDDLDATLARSLEQRSVERHAWTGHDQVGHIERSRRVPSELEVDARVAETVHPVEGPPHLAQHDGRSPTREQFGGRDTAASGAQHDHPAPDDGEQI
jgi:hypothetical protein